MKISPLKIQNKAFTEVYSKYPEFNVIDFNFHDRAELEFLKKIVDAGTIERLKSYQRLLRLHPDENVAERLIDKGYDSAHRIAAVPEHRFLADVSSFFNAGEARELYRNAQGTKAVAQHLMLNIKDWTVDQHFRQTRAFNAHSSLADTAGNIPSYQDLFGGLNFLNGSHEASIFGPGAYFLDLMRIVDNYITGPNIAKTSGNIPQEYLLSTRRPDLFDMKITEKNSVTLLPYLTLVNGVMEEHIEEASGGKPYQMLAAGVFPFNLPFNLPLAQIRGNMGALGTDLVSVYQALLAPQEADQWAADTMGRAIARETLGLSIFQESIVVTPQTTGPGLAPYFGYTDITATELNELRVVKTFLEKTGLQRKDLVDLLYQDTSPEERNAVAPTFFINDTHEPDLQGFMFLRVNNSDPENYQEEIVGLTLLRLDRLNRFIRLRAVVGWTYASLDWALKSVKATEIDNAMVNLAHIAQLQKTFDLPVDQVVCLFYDVKTRGRGEVAARPIDLFNTVFNNPVILQGQDPYEPGSQVPFDPAQPLAWDPAGTGASDKNIRSRLRAALAISDNDLTLLANYMLEQVAKEKLETDITNLSALLRLTVLSQKAQISITQFLLALDLLGPDKTGSLIQPKIPGMLILVQALTWLQESGLNSHDLDYIIRGGSTDYVSTPYTGGDLVPVINNFTTLAAGAQARPDSFLFNQIDIATSVRIFAYLQGDNPSTIVYVSGNGILTDQTPDFKVLAGALPVKQEDLVTDLITIDEAEAAFALLIIHNVILAETGDTYGPISETFSATTDLSYLFAGSDQRTEMQDQVREILLRTTTAVRHSSDLMDNLRDLQSANLYRGLANLLGSDQKFIALLFTAVARANMLPGYLVTFLTAIPENNILDPKVSAVVQQISRLVYQIDKLDLTEAEVSGMMTQGVTIGTGTFIDPCWDGMVSRWQFKALVNDFKDTGNWLLAYFSMPWPEAAPRQQDKKTEALASLTGWNAGQIARLITRFWPLDSAEASTVQGIWRLKAVFDISSSTGLDVRSQENIYQLATAPVVVNGVPDLPGWDIYENLAAFTLSAVGARFTGDEFTRVTGKLSKTIMEKQRNALLDYTIVFVQQTVPTVRKASDLSQYLLMDVEMSGCDNTSKIVQGTGSLQLYMQRARMGLEPYITELPIPAVWWSWMTAYRVWEANRKVFLYPENYIEPTLLHNPSPEFTQLREALLQEKVTKDSVASAYTEYLNGFDKMANLKIVSDYRFDVKDPVTGAVTETMFIFGRSNTEPYEYYYRTCENWQLTTTAEGKYGSSAKWSPWQRVNITIASAWVTPVYAFGKLMIFWVEVGHVTGTEINEKQQSADHTSFSALIKYSFINFQGRWAEPQVYDSRAMIDFVPNEYIAKTPYEEAYDPGFQFWHKVSIVHIPPNAFANPAPFDNDEQIMIFYGPAVSFHSYVTPIPTPPEPTPGKFPDQNELNDELYRLYHRVVALSRLPTPIVAGVVTAKPAATMSPTLLKHEQYVALANAPPWTLDAPIAYNGKVDQTKLKVAPYGSSPIAAEYYADSQSGSVPNVDTDAGTFRSPLTRKQRLGQNGRAASALFASASPGVDEGELLSNTAPANTSIISIKNQPGWFIFDNGKEPYLVVSQQPDLRSIVSTIVANGTFNELPERTTIVYNKDWAPIPTPPLDTIAFAFSRLGTGAVSTLSQTLFTSGIAGLLTIKSQNTKEPAFSRLLPTGQVVNAVSDQVDFQGAYGLYYWEVFFHTVFLVADALKEGQRFEEANTWYEYIFNPTARPVAADPEPPNPKDIFWQFLPFRGRTWESLVELLSDVQQIMDYNNNPFDPHAIARVRPSTYPKAIVMRYIDNLIGWGDALFAQDTRESVNQATHIYMLAADLLGPRPVAVGNLPAPVAMSYNDIKAAYSASGTAQAGTANTIVLAASASPRDRFYNGLTITLTEHTGIGQVRMITQYDGATRTATVSNAWDIVPDNSTTYQLSGIPQFLIELENSRAVWKISATEPLYSDPPFNDIDSYFGIPENREFLAYWDRVETRLYQIRHCMNRQGQVRTLTLFAPPVDPMNLVRAAAQGTLGQVVAHLPQPVPFYRFRVMIERAKNLCANLIGLEGSLLSVLEKGDAEQLALLRETQERAILGLTTRVKQDQITQLEEQMQALLKSKASAQKRLDYYTGLNTRGLSAEELTNLDSLRAALQANIAAAITRTAASIGYAVPQAGSPFALTYGGEQFGSVLTAASGVFEIQSMVAGYQGQRSLTMAGYDRRQEEWTFQADMAQLDLDQIGFQIPALDVQLQIAKQDLTIHEKNIEQNQEREAFFRRKFTNKDLYQWMSGVVSTLCFQTYSLAFDLARAAQQAFQYEKRSQQTFINFGYWDALHRGLLAGEGLMLALNQMETAYVNTAGRSLEIQKSISLMQINPRALLDLREKGSCEFELAELLFDQDYPGHYARTIKSLSISLPVVIGPYQSIKATLTQTHNNVALTDDIATVRYLLGIDRGAAPDASKLRSDWQVNQQIALSSGVSDSGLFQLDFQDERYLPFEGTGAVSNWRLSMPRAANRIDFQQITDLIIDLKYTALPSATLEEQVVKLAPVKAFASASYFGMAQTWQAGWFRMMNNHTNPAEQSIAFDLDSSLAPPQVRTPRLTGIGVYLQVKDGASAEGADYLTVTFPGETTPTRLAIPGNNFVFMDKSLVSFKEGWKLSFVLDQAPHAILDDDKKFLDPAKLTNVGLIFFYSGTLDWT